MYHHDEPRSLITSGGLGTMGFALPAAIGAKMARPEQEVWVVAGDGGFQMTMPELGDDCAGNGWTSRWPSSTTATSGWCGSGRSSSTSAAMPRTPLYSPDFVKIAEACGLAGQAISSRSDVVPASAGRARAPAARRCWNSALNRKTPSTRWCRPEPTSTR